MTPEEKAKELFNKICKASEPMFHSSELVRSEWIKICKEQTLIAVDELINEHSWANPISWNIVRERYWQQVKTEIEKL